MSEIDEMAQEAEGSKEGKSKKVYTYEWTVYHKRRYVAHFFEQESPDYVNAIRKRLAAIQQALRASRTNVMHEVLLAGLDKLEKEIEAGEKGEIPGVEDRGHELWAIAQKYKQIWKKRQRIADLEPIYNELGLDEFVKWCEEENIRNYKEFLKHFTWRHKKLPNSQRAENWLLEYLEPFEEGLPREEIFGAARKDGIISESYSEENLRKIGERLGLHLNDPRHGYWKRD